MGTETAVVAFDGIPHEESAEGRERIAKISRSANAPVGAVRSGFSASGPGGPAQASGGADGRLARVEAVAAGTAGAVDRTGELPARLTAAELPSLRPVGRCGRRVPYRRVDRPLGLIVSRT